MANLFIIGNGFDIAHEMKTEYRNFRNYLIENYTNPYEGILYIPESVVGHHGEELQNDNEVAGLITYLLDAVAPYNSDIQDIDWNELEKLLGCIDLSECFDTVEAQYDREGDRNYSWEHDVAASICSNMLLAIPRISEFFSDWIQTVRVSDTPKPKFQRMLANGDDLFLTFNYTKTLEKLYHCQDNNVCHIHGVVCENSFYSSQNLVIGHCGNIDYSNNDNVPYEMGSDLQKIYETLRKDTAKQISLNMDFFDKLKSSSIEKIYSYGFSFSEVDKPYIKMLCDYLNTAKTTWLFHSFNSLKERQSFQQTLIECGFAGKFDSFDA